MPLYNTQNFMHLLSGWRLCWLGGKLGGGKTSFAFRLAYDLMLQHGYRYLFSNCHSVWNDEPSEAVLRPNERGIPQFLDAVFILDEAGQFMGTASEAKEWTAFLRKLNVIVILASNASPHSSVKFLTVQRTLNMVKFGLPFWLYRWTLESMMIEEQGVFLWRNPSEIFGIYDTDAFPDEATELGNFLKEKINEAATNAGYRGQMVASAHGSAGDYAARQTLKAGQTVRPLANAGSGAASGSPLSEWLSARAAMADVGRDIDNLLEETKRTRKAAISVSKQKKRSR